MRVVLEGVLYSRAGSVTGFTVFDMINFGLIIFIGLLQRHIKRVIEPECIS